MQATSSIMSQRISLICSLGLFIAGYIFYSSSLIQSFYAAEFHLNSWQIGIAQSAVPLGAIAGAIAAGYLADLFGRKRLLVINFVLLVVLGVIAGAAVNFYSLCISRLLNGCLAGTLYPLCATYLIEMTPKVSVARRTAVLMFINCMAAPIACILMMVLAFIFTHESLWRALTLCQIIPALCAYFLAQHLPESYEWSAKKNIPHTLHFTVLFNATYRNRTICLMGAWFLMDVAYYGINFFIPYLLQLMQFHSLDSLSTQTLVGTFIINLFFVLGAFIAIFVIEKMNLFSLQKYGFLGAASSLFLLVLYFYAGLSHPYIIVLLFVIFNLAINIGPDVTTYLLSATSYPVTIRGRGHGFIAGFAKFGSFLGVLFLPRLQELWGYETVILFLAFLLFSAYLFTHYLAEIMPTETAITKMELDYETY